MSEAHPRRGAARLKARSLAIRLGARLIVSGIDLDVSGGDRIAVVGPNGSGKTTLLRGLAGIIPTETSEPPERATSANGPSLLIDDRELASVPRRQLAKRIAFMPQQPDLRFPMSGLEAVLLGRSPHKHGLGLASDRDVQSAEGAMRRLRVEHLADRPVTTLSGGERQRLMLARVLVQEADVLLLDEPTSAQDPQGVLLVRDVITEETERGVAIVAAVHDLNLALRDFSHVLVLAEGRALGHGAPADVLAEGVLEQAFGIHLRRVPDGEAFWVVPEPGNR